MVWQYIEPFPENFGSVDGVFFREMLVAKSQEPTKKSTVTVYPFVQLHLISS